jgi:hypothetical protein
MPSPEGNSPHHLDLRSLKPLPQKREVGSGVKRLASHPEGEHAVSSHAPNAGERQENQEHKLILPSYLPRRAHEILKERFTHHTKESLEGTGWDSFAELVFDRANILPKPDKPNIPPDDLDTLDEEGKLKHFSANTWEERAIDHLIQDEDMHLIPDFKRQMQEYRESVKSIVHLWREKGLL